MVDEFYRGQKNFWSWRYNDAHILCCSRSMVMQICVATAIVTTHYFVTSLSRTTHKMLLRTLLRILWTLFPAKTIVFVLETFCLRVFSSILCVVRLKAVTRKCVVTIAVATQICIAIDREQHKIWASLYRQLQKFFWPR